MVCAALRMFTLVLEARSSKPPLRGSLEGSLDRITIWRAGLREREHDSRVHHFDTVYPAVPQRNMGGVMMSYYDGLVERLREEE